MKKSNSAVKVGKLKHSQTIVINNNSKDMPQIKTARMLTSQRSLPVEIGEPFEESPLPKAGNKKIVKELTKSTSVEVNQLKKEKVSKVVRGHLMAVRDKRRATIMQNHLYDKSITGKEFGADDNDGKDAATWKNRQSDWYNAERRFVFACKTTKERDKWVEKIVMEKI